MMATRRRGRHTASASASPTSDFPGASLFPIDTAQPPFVADDGASTGVVDANRSAGGGCGVYWSLAVLK
ncbi:MAG TPA: hypothetical protein VNZ26_19825, partial [Vicinamibacterales bacterium]|nr:hypothetical protein [Vicinamibacterales bacterium]